MVKKLIKEKKEKNAETLEQQENRKKKEAKDLARNKHKEMAKEKLNEEARGSYLKLDQFNFITGIVNKSKSKLLQQ